jgi:hypothetical protein
MANPFDTFDTPASTSSTSLPDTSTPPSTVPVEAKNPFDAFDGSSQTPKHDFSWSQAITDIPSEIGNDWNEGTKAAKEGLLSKPEPGAVGALKNIGNTASGLAGLGRAGLSWATGPIKSVVGHTLANAEHLAGEHIVNPLLQAAGVPEDKLQHPDPDMMYENAKKDVDTALAALPASKTVPKAVSTVPRNEVVDAADRIASTTQSPVEVPRAFASDSTAVQRAGQLARNVPIVGDSIPQATGRMADQLGDAASSIASSHGEGSGPNVANRIGNKLSTSAEAETKTAQDAARASDDTVLADWQRSQDNALHQVDQHEASALNDAQTATGNMSPQDMGQTLISRLRANETAARANKDALYETAGNSDASVRSDAVQGVHDRVADALHEQGRVIDPELTPASSRMMQELDNFSQLQIPNRVGPSAPNPADIASVDARGMEQVRKRLNSISQAASNDADRAVTNIIRNQFDEWQQHAYDTALFSGSPEALQSYRDARSANASWRQNFYNDRDDADRLINRVVTGEVTPQEMSNWLVGNTQVGSKGVSSRLLTRIGEITNNDPEAMGVIRSAVANRLFGTAEGATTRAPEKTASGIYEFFNNSGRDIANRLFTPEQHQAAINYANTLRRAAAAREDIASVAKNTKPSPTPFNPGPMQELATSVLGKGGKSDEALFNAIDAYSKSGGRADIATLSDILKAIPEKDRGDLAGAIIRGLGKSAQTKGFSLEQFATDWAKYSPQAKTLLFGNAGPHRQALDDIAAIAQRYKEVGRRFGNPSGTGQTVTGFGALAAIFTHPYTAIPALVGGAVFARMLSAPATATSVAKFMKASAALQNGSNHLRLAAFNTSAAGLLRAAQAQGSNLTMPVLLKRLANGPQGPGTSDAKERADGGAVSDPNDMTDQYNTNLSPDNETKFQDWAKANPRLGSTYDYDARGFWQAGAAQADNGHGSDQWKKPNHPTFSNQSQYNDNQNQGGAWAQRPDGSYSYAPSSTNLKYNDPNDLQDYFNKQEQGNELLLPQKARGGVVKGFADGGVPDDIPDPVAPATDMQDYLAHPEKGYQAPASELAGKASDLIKTQSDRLPAATDNKDIDAALLPDADTRSDIVRHLSDAPFSEGTKAGNRLFGTGGEDRYQTWPERMIRSGATLAGDALHGDFGYTPGLRREDVTDIPAPQEPTEDSTWLGKKLGIAPVSAEPQDPLIERAQDMAGMAGGAGLSTGVEGAGAAALGSAPFLRPALKMGDKIYKAPVGGEHIDALPQNLRSDYYNDALAGNDISKYNFGFMNHKGQFLDREKALDYAVNEGLVDPSAAKQGALTSTILEDSSVGAPLSALERAKQQGFDTDNTLYHGTSKDVDFKKFKDSRHGTWSTEDPESASSYAKENDSKGYVVDNDARGFAMKPTNTADRVIPMYAKPLENPYTGPTPDFVQKASNYKKAQSDWFDQLKRQGYDGLQQGHGVRVDFNNANLRSTFAQFDPKNEGKSGLLLSDSGTPGAAITAAEHAQPFYSAVEKTLQAAPQSKMHGEQWANWLKNQPGVKPDEMQYTGLDNWLREQNGPVTKQQVSDYVDKNKVQVNDVEKKSDFDKYELNEAIQKIVDNKVDSYHDNYGHPPNRYELEEIQQDAEHSVRSHPEDHILSQTKYSNYQIPGGENYREHLLTLPENSVPAERYAQLQREERAASTRVENYMSDVWKEHGADWKNKITSKESKHIENIQKQAGDAHEALQSAFNHNKSAIDYKSSHWDEPNVLAHVRTNDRDVGGQPSLHLEELQSDMHQAGRKNGYKDSTLTEKGNDPNRDLTSAEADAIRENNSKVPDAPFKTSWPELTMKRMIVKAASEGKSRISWTPGDAQAARYDLSKSIKKLQYDPETKNIYAWETKQSNGVGPSIAKSATPEQLPDIVGKDAAKKLLDTKKNDKGMHILEGNEIKIGGEGMKGFYDQMMPKMVEKLGKQYGVKVKQSDTFGPKYPGLGEHAENKSMPVHYFDIPEKMKQDALSKGFPLFSDTSHGGLLNQNAKKQDKDVERPVQKQKTNDEINVPARAAGGRVQPSNINRSPSQPQKSYGNYKKDHLNIHGLSIAIENAKGHKRTGVGADGKPWESVLPEHYGYLKQTEGADGDHVDCFLGPHLKSNTVFVINQVDHNTKKFDEHKVFIGFRNLDHVLSTYEKAFSDGKGLQRIGSVVPTTMDELKNWLKTQDTKEPYKNQSTYNKKLYKGVKVDHPTH